MLTRLAIRNFKLFDKVELELGDRVVLIGPNNAGKTTALQALALWNIGLKRWLEKRGADEQRMAVPEAAGAVRVAYLPPMSGLAANETRLDAGAINVRLGEGRTAEVLRNLCYQIISGADGEDQWARIAAHIEELFGSRLDKPRYVTERGEITMTYRSREGVRLDLSASGRGEQQTLLLLAHLSVNPRSVLLLDEPDAHLEILRQRQIYQLLSDTAQSAGSQIIAASHSEVVLNEAADRDVLIAFVGRPHRIDDRGSQVAKALKEIGFEHYLQAEEKGWVLYLEGATDLAILLALARRLQHPAAELLQSPYVHYVANQPARARAHFYGLREARPDLLGMAIYDRLERNPPEDPNLNQLIWRRREIENYLCQRPVLLDFAATEGERHAGELFASAWRSTMDESIAEIEQALKTLAEPDPWGPDIKASEAFLDPLFKRFYDKLKLPNLMTKTHYHRLAGFVEAGHIDPEISDKLDALVSVAGRACLRED